MKKVWESGCKQKH